MSKIVQIATSCTKCPYATNTQALGPFCTRVNHPIGRREFEAHQIPTWCVLPNYPDPSGAMHDAQRFRFLRETDFATTKRHESLEPWQWDAVVDSAMAGGTSPVVPSASGAIDKQALLSAVERRIKRIEADLVPKPKTHVPWWRFWDHETEDDVAAAELHRNELIAALARLNVLKTMAVASPADRVYISDRDHILLQDIAL